MDYQSVSMQSAVLKPDAGLIILSFQGTEVLPFSEGYFSASIKQDILNYLPYVAGDLLCRQTVDVSGITFLLELYEFMQSILA